MKASIITVNWNGKKYLKECLESIYKQRYEDYEVIFVDNNSTDGSAEFVEKHFPKTKVLRLNSNMGFAGGNNAGIRIAQGEYIILINNDTIVADDWLYKLIKVADKDKKIGMVSSKTLLFNLEMDTMGIQVLKSGLGYDVKDKKDVNKIFCPSGVSVLYRRDMLEDIKIEDEYFDEDFFCYCEDTDLGFRARLRGWKFAFAKDSKLMHRHGGTSSGKITNITPYYGHRNNLLVVIKNYPLGWLITYSPQIIVSQLASIALYFAKLQPGLILKAKWDMLKLLPRMIRKRWQIQRNVICKDLPLQPGCFK